MLMLYSYICLIIKFFIFDVVSIIDETLETVRILGVLFKKTSSISTNFNLNNKYVRKAMLKIEKELKMLKPSCCIFVKGQMIDRNVKLIWCLEKYWSFNRVYSLYYIIKII